MPKEKTMTLNEAVAYLAERGTPYGYKTLQVAIKHDKTLKADLFGDQYLIRESDLVKWVETKKPRRGVKPGVKRGYR